MTLFPTPSSKIGILLAPPGEGDATPRGGKNASAPVIIDLMGASGELKVGDRLVRVDGVDVADQPSAVAEMQAKLAKLILTQAKLTLCVERKSERKTSSTSRTRAKGSPRGGGGGGGGNAARPVTVVRHAVPPVYEETAHPTDSPRDAAQIAPGGAQVDQAAVELPEVGLPPEVTHVVTMVRI